MDGRTLMDIMQSPNFSMWGPAEQAFNTSQEKAKADLATTLGMERRANEMQPVEIAHKNAATALNNTTAQMNQYALDTKLPKDKALELVMQKFHKETDENTRTALKEQVMRNMQLAAMAKQNNGVIPAGIKLSPEETKLFDPKNLDGLIKFGQTFLQYDPAEIAQRQRAAERKDAAVAAAAEAGKYRVEAAGTARPGSGGGAKVPKSPRELMSYYDYKAQTAETEEEKQKYIALAQEQEVIYQRELLLKAQAANEGKMDVPATAASGVPVARPSPAAVATPRAGAASGAKLPSNVTTSGWK